MADIIISEAAFDEFLKFLHAKRKELVAEMQSDVEAFRARLAAHGAVLRAQLEVAHERKLREMEEKIERKIRAVEEEIARKRREAEDQIECKRRAAEDEIARLQQLERLRQTAAVEPSEWPQ
jgi:hypothetical protein